jgi:hypothetical protein
MPQLIQTERRNHPTIQNDSADLADEKTCFEDFLHMSERNYKKLHNAYRHPFEYISPLLYRKSVRDEDEKLPEARELFCASEEDFLRLSHIGGDEF